jgi:hypothetical protein
MFRVSKGSEFQSILSQINISDNANGRALATQLADNVNLTMESCIASCAAQNFTIAAGEFSVGKSLSP